MPCCWYYCQGCCHRELINIRKFKSWGAFCLFILKCLKRSAFKSCIFSFSPMWVKQSFAVIGLLLFFLHWLYCCGFCRYDFRWESTHHTSHWQTAHRQYREGEVLKFMFILVYRGLLKVHGAWTCGAFSHCQVISIVIALPPHEMIMYYKLNYKKNKTKLKSALELIIQTQLI